MSDFKPTVLGLSISMPILASVAVGLRFYSRSLTKTAIGKDDWLILGALVFSIGLSIDAICAVYLGNLGGHLEYNAATLMPLNVDQYQTFCKLAWAAQILSVPAIGLNKMSVLFFYKRIFARGKYFQPIVWANVGIVVAWIIAFIVANLLDCRPLSSNWSASLDTSDSCVNLVTLFFFITLTDIITDVIILVLPVPQVWRLQMSLRHKLQVCGIFLLGSFTVIAGIARLVGSANGISSVNSDFDYTYSEAPLYYWTITEVCVGVISACLPVLRPIFVRRNATSGNSYPLLEKSGPDGSNGSSYKPLGLPQKNFAYHSLYDTDESDTTHMIPPTAH